MSREEVSAFLANWQISLDGLQKQIDASLRELPNVKRDELPRFLAALRKKWQTFQEEQQDEWDRFVEECGLQVEEEDLPGSSEAESSGTVTPFNVKLKSLEQRVAAMGGIPALGAVVLPKMTPGQKAGLQVTSSPAAVEILRGRLGSDADAHTPLRKTSSGEEQGAVTPLVTLRKTAPPVGLGGSALLTPGAAPPNSELAAAIQRRAAHRQQAEEATATA